MEENDSQTDPNPETKPAEPTGEDAAFDALEEKGKAILAQLKPQKETTEPKVNFFKRFEQGAAFWATAAHLVLFVLLFQFAGYYFGRPFRTEEMAKKISVIHRVVYDMSFFFHKYWYYIYPPVAAVIIFCYTRRKMLTVRQYAVIVAVWWALIAVSVFIIVSPVWSYIAQNKF